MKLWLISQTANNNYDTYDSAVVAAETEELARLTYPNEYQPDTWPKEGSYPSWVDAEKVSVKWIGEAAARTEAGVILASFNSG